MNTSIEVLTRPFAIEPVTNVMLPDGIFDNAIYNLLIACHFTNTSGSDLSNVEVYLESVGDPGILVTAQTYVVPRLAAGASILVSWNAGFKNAQPGKPLISFIAKANGFTAHRSIQQIFVTQTRYDAVAKKWNVTIPEGRLEVTHLYAIPPGADWWSCGDKNECPPSWLAPHVISGVQMEWYPNPPYAGKHGDLPFSDPWWKIIALIVAAIAAIVGAIAAAEGAGAFEPGVKGTYNDDPGNPSVMCCTPNPGSGFKNNATTIAGVCATICSVAIAVACSDEADPIWRGQEHTDPKPGELTVSEHVEAHWQFLDDPNPGTPYRTKVAWKYSRATTGETYSYHVEEEQTNIHVVDNIEIDTPATVHAYQEPLWVRAQFTKPNHTLYTGAQLYGLALFESPGGFYFIERLADDGLNFDNVANDGTYSAGLNLELAYRALLKEGQNVSGVWKVFIYAQEVNLTKPGTLPQVAAQTVGGSFIASAVSITFDPSLPCPLKAQATIMVV